MGQLCVYVGESDGVFMLFALRIDRIYRTHVFPHMCVPTPDTVCLREKYTYLKDSSSTKQVRPGCSVYETIILLLIHVLTGDDVYMF